jgi:hypothetical protein
VILMIASFGLQVADPTITWPQQSESALCEPSAGWTKDAVALSTSKAKPVVVDALCYGELCVHRMVDDEGFTITTKANGLRIFSRGRIFARCQDAMAMAEYMTTLYSGWTEHTGGVRNVPSNVGAEFTKAHDEAERRGEILRDMVFPG